MDNAMDIIQRVIMFLSIIGNMVFCLMSYLKARAAKKSSDMMYKQLDKNKENQKEYEKGVESMARTLCDKCGKEIEVRECVQYTALNAKQYDVCTDCAAHLKANDSKVSGLWAQVDEYTAKIEELKAQIKTITGE